MTREEMIVKAIEKRVTRLEAAVIGVPCARVRASLTTV
jgi:hypothetical protein